MKLSRKICLLLSRKINSFPLFVSFALLVNCSCQSPAAKNPPNFLIIIADDAGWNDVGYHGSKIKTPNIDRLAEEGVQMERFYVHPTCSPSRAALLTGKPASRLGIVKPISGKSEQALPDTVPTLPQVLKEHGYQTALSGKWHLGLKPASGPAAYGFDYSYGFLHGQIDQYSHEYKNGDYSWHENGNLLKEEGHATDLITSNTLKQLDKFAKNEKPFYLHVAYTAPHIPLQEEDKWIEPYDTVFKSESKKKYAAAMSHMDHSIGKLLASLQENEMEENTVVIFMSDNGAQENWNPGNDLYEGRFKSNPVLGSNDPLRGFKTSTYEGGIRVPAVLKGAGFPKNKKYDEYIAVYDIYPTLLEMAGINPEDYPSVEGLSFYSSMKNGESLKERDIYIRGHLGAAVINDGLKLIWHQDKSDKKMELYNVENDPSEENELPLDSEKAESMKTLMKENIRKDNVDQ